MDNLHMAEMFRDAYSQGRFEPLFDCFTDDYSHISFWVTEAIQGKERAMDYYINKGRAIRSGSLPQCKIVEIVMAPDKVRPRGLFVNGKQVEEDPIFLNRKDKGKYAVYMEQIVDSGELVQTLAIPSVDETGKCCQLLITNPGFYDWVEC